MLLWPGNARECVGLPLSMVTLEWGLKGKLVLASVQWNHTDPWEIQGLVNTNRPNYMPRVWGFPIHCRKTCFLLVEFPKRIVPVDKLAHLFSFSHFSFSVIEMVCKSSLTSSQSHSRMACPHWNQHNFLCGHVLGYCTFSKDSSFSTGCILRKIKPRNMTSNKTTRAQINIGTRDPVLNRLWNTFNKQF